MEIIKRRRITHISRCSTLCDRLLLPSPNDKADIVLAGVGRSSSLVLVQIHVVAYMFTLSYVSDCIGKQSGNIENLPIDARAGEAGADTAGCEPILFELLDIPRLDAGRAEENAAVHFQGVVEFLGLDRCFCAFGIEPVHRVHDLANGLDRSFGQIIQGAAYHSDCQASGSDSLDHFVDLICVNT